MFYTHMAAALLYPALLLPPQAAPNLAGVWEIIDITPRPKEAGAAALPPGDLTITQTATALTLSTTTPWGDVKTAVHSLDGREDRNLSGAVTRLTRSKWIGASLLTEGRMSQVTSQGYAAWTLHETLRIDTRGHLIIERKTRSDSGEEWHSVTTHRRRRGR
jgi:hypothetical protein